MNRLEFALIFAGSVAALSIPAYSQEAGQKGKGGTFSGDSPTAEDLRKMLPSLPDPDAVYQETKRNLEGYLAGGLVERTTEPTPPAALGPALFRSGCVRALPGIFLEAAAFSVGGAASVFTPEYRYLKLLGDAGDLARVADAYLAEGEYGAANEAAKYLLAEYAVGKAVAMAGRAQLAGAGFGAIAAGTAAFSFGFGQACVAPLIAPWTGEKMFKLAPDLFTPLVVPGQK